jgi:hypothetical protein
MEQIHTVVWEKVELPALDSVSPVTPYSVNIDRTSLEFRFQTYCANLFRSFNKLAIERIGFGKRQCETRSSANSNGARLNGIRKGLHILFVALRSLLHFHFRDRQVL